MPSATLGAGKKGGIPPGIPLLTVCGSRFALLLLLGSLLFVQIPCSADFQADADAVLFITPEYNRSFPGVLKNAVDWGSRPYGQNLWDKKPAGVMGATISAIGTFGAQHHLRQVLAYLNMSVMGQPEFYFNASNAFDDRGRLINEKSKEFVQNYWIAFMNWIERVGETKAPRIEGTFPATGQEDSPYAH